MSPSWFQCTNCEARYRFEERLAGRAMACRQCGAVFRVPPVPVHLAAPGMPVSVEQRWHLKLASGREFGPVLQDVVAEWVKEGRADADSLVCQDGTVDWYRLPDIFPQFLAAAPAPGHPDEFTPVPGIAEYLPAAGLLEHIPDEWNDMNASARDAQQQALEGIEREVRRSMGAVKLTAVRHLITEEAKEFGGESPRDAVQMRPDHLLLCEFSAHSTCFCVIVPWGRMGRMAHEIFSILPGALPHSLALRRAREDHYAGGMWIGINGRDDDMLALSAARSQEQLASGIIWNWYSEKRDYTMVQVWGVQAVPLGAEKFLHAVQTNGRGPGGHELGLLWYLEKQSAFYRFARRLSVPDTHETHILFASNAAQILCRAAHAIVAAA
jgi:hypothetical protein